MLSLKLKLYLRANLSKPSIDFNWSDEDNNNFLNFLNKNCDKECLQDIQTNLIIKQAFKEYFESIGYILFKFKENKINIKVLPYKIEPKDSINLPSILKIMENNENLIEYDYKGNSNNISIPLELKTEIYNFVNSIENEEINKKELVIFAINQFFELNQNDIVIVKKDQIFIKILDNTYNSTVSEHVKRTGDNRYNGIDEEELKPLYDNFFSKQKKKELFLNVAKIVVKIYISDEAIDHITYEKKIFSYIKFVISEQIKNSYNLDNNVYIGLSGYIFRKHFKDVFGHIANLLLTEIVVSNDHIIDFLKYYSKGIIVINGKRYKVPEIESENGVRWNVVSMLSIAKIYIKTKISIKKANDEIEILNKSIKTLYINNLSPLDYHSMLIKKQQKVEVQISDNKERLERLSDALNILKSNNLNILKNENEDKKEKEIQNTKEELQRLMDEKREMKHNAVDSNLIVKYKNIRQKIDALAREVQENEKKLTQKEEAYLSIKYALIKALASKKILLE